MNMNKAELAITRSFALDEPAIFLATWMFPGGSPYPKTGLHVNYLVADPPTMETSLVCIVRQISITRRTVWHLFLALSRLLTPSMMKKLIMTEKKITALERSGGVFFNAVGLIVVACNESTEAAALVSASTELGPKMRLAHRRLGHIIFVVFL